jgi:hypothetical protein|nr:MAG TPA: hypothetical protein [Caudoviricetes sp.]DAT30828.1 MAG TPA: hypothetical protein [Caudoviricetes sp.]
MTIVRIEDCRKLGLCNHGLRQVCKENGIDWWDFLDNGISEERILKINHAMVHEALRVAKERENG